MEKFRHTIRLTVDSDGPIQYSREFFSIRIAPLMWLSIVINAEGEINNDNNLSSLP